MAKIKKNADSPKRGQFRITDEGLVFYKKHSSGVQENPRTDSMTTEKQNQMHADNPQEPMRISVEKLFPSGALILTTEYRGKYYRHRYFQYTAAEAKRIFREYVLDEDSKIFREVPPLRVENPRQEIIAQRLARGES
jgi:hypothetical protein